MLGEDLDAANTRLPVSYEAPSEIKRQHRAVASSVELFPIHVCPPAKCQYQDSAGVGARNAQAEAMQWAVCDPESGRGMLETPTRPMIRAQARLLLEHCAILGRG
jgi:hypothetical protein